MDLEVKKDEMSGSEALFALIGIRMMKLSQKHNRKLDELHTLFQSMFSKETAITKLESEFYSKVNQLISMKITPIYNTVIVIFAAIFAYFSMQPLN